MTTLLVDGGTLRKGDILLAGQYSGRVRNMFNERGQAVEEAGPSMPVPSSASMERRMPVDHFYVFEDSATPVDATRRQQLQREQGIRTYKHITLDEIGRRLAIGDFQELNIIVKGDVDGSVEALTDSLLKLSTEQIEVNVMPQGRGSHRGERCAPGHRFRCHHHRLPGASHPGARKLAESEEIDIRLYSIIYDAIEEIPKQAMEGLLAPKITEKVTGTRGGQETFRISGVVPWPVASYWTAPSIGTTRCV